MLTKTPIPESMQCTYALACNYLNAHEYLDIDPCWLKYVIERVGLLEETIRELLKDGEHEGDCTNEEPDGEGNYGPCWRHIKAARDRQDAAKLVLEEPTQQNTGSFAVDNEMPELPRRYPKASEGGTNK